MAPPMKTSVASRLGSTSCCPAPGEVDTAGDGRAAGSRLVDGEQQRRDEEWQQIVDQPIGDQRAGDARGMGALGQRQQQHRLEHAEPGRDVADHAGDAGRREDTGEGEEAQADRGQQNPEGQCGEGPVGHRQGRAGRSATGADGQAKLQPRIVSGRRRSQPAAT